MDWLLKGVLYAPFSNQSILAVKQLVEHEINVSFDNGRCLVSRGEDVLLNQAFGSSLYSSSNVVVGRGVKAEIPKNVFPCINN
jgi:hypothetical protein